MNQEQQRIAIAEACGWQDIYHVSGNYCGLPPLGHFKAGEMMCHPSLPDYLNDLNAMHAAEGKLKLDQHRDYHDHLQKFCRYPEFCNAAQRAEAFLKTLNLWEEE